MQVTNQKPVELTPVYTALPNGALDMTEYIKETLVKPLFNPLVPGTNVTVTDKNAAVSEDDIAAHIANCLGDIISKQDETWCSDLFHRTLSYFDPNSPLNIGELFLTQIAVKHQMAYPSSNVLYIPADVIQTADDFLNGRTDADQFIASLGFYARTPMLGVYFINQTAFGNFKTWLATQIGIISKALSADTLQMFQEFQNTITLSDLTESLTVRNTQDEGNDEYSFPRVLTAMLMNYTKQVSPAFYGIMPVELSELFCPLNIVFVNVEQHAHASNTQISAEWDIIKKSVQMNLNIVSNNKLTQLTSTGRQVKALQGALAVAAKNAKPDVYRSGYVAFRKTQPSKHDIVHMLSCILGKMKTVNMSDNTYKSTKMTFNKPNRRDPDDFNKRGKQVSTRYLPDIHIYQDTSGSISEENYQTAIQLCIMIAKKLNVNLYFNSFSDVLSQCTKLKTKDTTVLQSYALFQKVPKVTGGTDYKQIWDYINMSKKRLRELSIIITDFEYWPPRQHTDHPQNLYYMACLNMDWNEIRTAAKTFCDNMTQHDPNIRRHILL